VTLPFDPASVPAGRAPALYKTTGANQWVQVSGASFGSNSVTAQITSFSWVQVNGLLRSDPVRAWEFGAFPGDGSTDVSLGGATQVGGLLEQIVEFGSGLADIDVVAMTQTFPADTKAVKAKPRLADVVRSLGRRKVALMLALGFSSGLPFMLSPPHRLFTRS